MGRLERSHWVSSQPKQSGKVQRRGKYIDNKTKITVVADSRERTLCLRVWLMRMDLHGKLLHSWGRGEMSREIERGEGD